MNSKLGTWWNILRAKYNFHFCTPGTQAVVRPA